MCAQKLWQVVRHWEGQAVVADAPPSALGRLGRWAATRFQEQSDDLVLAISERGCFTVVIPLAGAEDFASAFRDAVGAALQDLGVRGTSIAQELAGLAPVSLHYLRDPELRDALNQVKDFCGLELAYLTDPRLVQRNLNDLPRPMLSGLVPAECVVRLFEAGDATSTDVH